MSIAVLGIIQFTGPLEAIYIYTIFLKCVLVRKQDGTLCMSVDLPRMCDSSCQFYQLITFQMKKILNFLCYTSVVVQLITVFGFNCSLTSTRIGVCMLKYNRNSALQFSASSHKTC